MAVVTSKEQYLRFVVRFFAFFAAFVLIAILLPESFNHWYNAVWARLVAGILSLTGHAAHVSKAVVSYKAFRVAIIPECTGLIAAGLLVSFVMSYPSSLGGR